MRTFLRLATLVRTFAGRDRGKKHGVLYSVWQANKGKRPTRAKDKENTVERKKYNDTNTLGLSYRE